MNAPAYKLTKHVARILEQHAPLPHSFNIRNIGAVLMDLKDIPWRHETCIIQHSKFVQISPSAD